MLRRLFERIRRADLITSIARRTGLVLILRVLSLVMAYVVHILFARWMGAMQYGIYSYTMAWIAILAILASLGLSTAVLRFVPEYRVKEKWALLRGVILGSSYLTLAAGLMLSIAGTVVILVLERSQYTIPLVVGVWIVPLVALVQLQSEICKARGRVVLAHIPLLIRHLLILTGTFLFLQQMGAPGAIEVLVLLMFVLMAIYGVLAWKVNQDLPPEAKRTHPYYRIHMWLRVSLPMLLVAGTSIVLNQTDIIMIGVLLDSSKIGIYNAAIKTSGLVVFIIMAVNTVVAPVFAELYARKDNRMLQRIVSATAHWIFWPSLAIALLLAVFADPILGFFGPEFVSGRWVLRVMLAGQLVNAAAGSVGYLMQMSGHQDDIARVFCCSALMNIILNAICISTLGIMGAALATTTAMILWNVWLYILVVRKLEVHPSVISCLWNTKEQGD